MKTILLLSALAIVLTSCFTNRKAQKAIPQEAFAEMQSSKGHYYQTYKTPIRSFDKAVANELKAKPGSKVYMLYAFEGDSYPRTEVYKYKKLLNQPGVQAFFISNNHDMLAVPALDSIAPGTTIYMADGRDWRFEMRPKRKNITEALIGGPRPAGYKAEYFIEYLALNSKNELVYLGTDVDAPALQAFLKNPS